MPRRSPRAIRSRPTSGSVQDDAIISTVVGEDSVTLHGSFDHVDKAGGAVPIATESELNRMPLDACASHLASLS
jgi:hypothetical protein